MKQVRAIIFDLDGTLIDSERDIVNAINFMLKELNLKQKDPGLIASYVGYGRDFLLKGVIGNSNLHLLSKAISTFRNYYSRHLLDNTVLFPGTSDILNWFNDKKKIVLSNRETKSAQKMLKKLGVIHHFVKVSGGDNVQCMKPSPCPVEKIISELNIPKENVIMVGDMAVDIESGKGAGVITCGVTYGIGKKEDIVKSKPDYIIDDIKELKNIIE